MKQFCVLYMMPLEGLEEWVAKPEEDRKAAETEMKAQWDTWLAEHASTVKNTIGLGKTKRVTAGGIEDTKNNLMLSSYVEAESHEAAAEIFRNHPHFGIPGASIDVMEINPMKPE